MVHGLPAMFLRLDIHSFSPGCRVDGDSPVRNRIS